MSKRKRVKPGAAAKRILAALPGTTREVAERSGCSVATVRGYLRKWLAAGTVQRRAQVSGAFVYEAAEKNSWAAPDSDPVGDALAVKAALPEKDREPVIPSSRAQAMKEAVRKRQRGVGKKCAVCGADMFVERSILDPRYPVFIARDRPRIQFWRCAQCKETVKKV